MSRAAPLCLLPLLALAAPALASDHGPSQGPALAGVRVELLLFAATLVGVALLHKHALWVALGGLAAILAWNAGFTTLALGPHLLHEAPGLLNLLGLLLGFALLARHFEESHVPERLPAVLPDDWKGGFALLALVAVISAFLDNIAAALIGGTMARAVFRGEVHLGFLAAIVAASNAGGAGSVVGDTTTTMIWLEEVSPLVVARAAIGAVAALAVFGVVAARQQHALRPIEKDAQAGAKPVDRTRLLIVLLILIGAIGANLACGIPALGVWGALLLGAALRPTAWGELPGALKGSLFLLSLVTAASTMPVHELPAASWQTTLGLGFVSAVFDNIPLTKLALQQGGYDWGLVAYAVGFGGSMVWFGSSAGVALSGMYPEARSVGAWLRQGWHVAVAYVVGFFAILAVAGWSPSETGKELKRRAADVAATSSATPAAPVSSWR